MFGKMKSANSSFVMAMGRKAGNIKRIAPNKAPTMKKAMAPQQVAKKFSAGPAVPRKMASAGKPASRSITQDAPAGKGKAPDRMRHMKHKQAAPKVIAAQGVERTFDPAALMTPPSMPRRLSKGKTGL